MKETLISMLLFLAAMVALAVHKGVLVEGLKHSAVDFGKFLPILAIAFILMGLTDVLLPKQLVERWLSDEAGWKGLLMA